jgi:hypothetical protein
MSWPRKVFPSVFVLLLPTMTAIAQQTSQMPNISAMAQAIPPGTNVALTGAITTNGVSGTISLSATPNGQTQIQVSLPSGSETETRSISHWWRSGSWVDSSGASHQIPPQDLMGPHPAWFFPTFVLISGLGSPDYFSSNLGIETRNGVSVEHIEVWQVPIASLPASSAAYVQQQSQYDIYLDPSTSLPVAMTFTRQFAPGESSQFLAPAQTSSTGVLEDVEYSNYQQVQGVQVPFHLQMFFQGALYSDIRISSANFTPVQGSIAAN